MTSEFRRTTRLIFPAAAVSLDTGTHQSMRLVQKVTIAMVLGMCTVAAVHGFLRVRRDAQFFQTDMRRDHQLPGRLLGAAVADTWRTQGRPRAIGLIQAADRTDGRVRISWLDGPARGPDGWRDGRFYSYVPVAVGGVPVGTLEFSESFDEEAAYIRSSAIRTFTTTLLMALVAVVLSAILGVVFVGRPMLRLTEKARRVGTGDLTGPLVLKQHDEIGELGREMNAMCERLAAANLRVLNETDARLRALEQLRHADRLATVGKLASGVAHELGTPLNVVSARAKMIVAQEVEGEGLRESARIIGEQAERITRIVRQLLEFARGRSAGSGAVPLGMRAPTDLRTLAERTVALLGPFADKRDISLSLGATSDNANATVEIDARAIEQAVTNLVVNAIQAMRKPGRVTVTIMTQNATPPADLGGGADTFVRLSVTDEGTGMAADVLPHVFEPFFTTKEIGEGTGLGLSVSYGIVREHNGWIAVETVADQGSTFSIYLPSFGASPTAPPRDG
jgi:two-component system NtrC family sensor kinase